MGKIGKTFALMLTLIIAISCLTLVTVKLVNAQSPKTQNYTYVVSNYAVNYTIISSNAGYNLLVYQNYPPFNIEISFYDGNQKVTDIAGTNSYSTTLFSTNYPIQITMKVTNEPASTPSPTKSPTVPEFSVKYVDQSYDISVNTTIDPFTGKTVIIPAQHINNQTIIVTIKNQTILNEDNYLYYQIQMKGHYSQEWSNISFIQANTFSKYTVLVYALDGNNASGDFTSRLDQVSSEGTIDFQVQAQIWHYEHSEGIFDSWDQVLWTASDWSNTQTVTISTSSSSTSPAVLKLSWLVIVPLLLSVFAVAVIVRYRKTALTK